MHEDKLACCPSWLVTVNFERARRLRRDHERNLNLLPTLLEQDSKERQSTLAFGRDVSHDDPKPVLAGAFPSATRDAWTLPSH